MQYSIEKPKGTFYSDYTIQNGICDAIFEHDSRVTSKRVCKTDKTNQNWREFTIQETPTHLIITL